jgi:hypothetical protein
VQKAWSFPRQKLKYTFLGLACNAPQRLALEFFVAFGENRFIIQIKLFLSFVLIAHLAGIILEGEAELAEVADHASCSSRSTACSHGGPA